MAVSDSRIQEPTGQHRPDLNKIDSEMVSVYKCLEGKKNAVHIFNNMKMGVNEYD